MNSAQCITKYHIVNEMRLTRNKCSTSVAPVNHSKYPDQDVEIKTPDRVQTDLLIISQDTFLMSGSLWFNMCIIIIMTAIEAKSMHATSKLASLCNTGGASTMACQGCAAEPSSLRLVGH